MANYALVSMKPCLYKLLAIAIYVRVRYEIAWYNLVQRHTQLNACSIASYVPVDKFVRIHPKSNGRTCFGDKKKGSDNFQGLVKCFWSYTIARQKEKYYSLQSYLLLLLLFSYQLAIKVLSLSMQLYDYYACIYCYSSLCLCVEKKIIWKGFFPCVQ